MTDYHTTFLGDTPGSKRTVKYVKTAEELEAQVRAANKIGQRLYLESSRPFDDVAPHCNQVSMFGNLPNICGHDNKFWETSFEEIHRRMIEWKSGWNRYVLSSF